MRAPLELPEGGYVLPGNRWDLLDGCWPPVPPNVSVIIPYFDAQDQLDRVLGALTLQTHPDDRLEIVVADDGSPAPPSLAAAGTIRTRLVRQDDRGFRAGAARNLGAHAACGDVLCFLDADTVPEPDYIRAIARLPALVPDALVTGRRRHADFAGWVGDIHAWFSGQLPGPTEFGEPDWLIEGHRRSHNLLQLRPDSYRYVISAVMACSRRLFMDVGGFDGSRTQYGGEDWEFAHRALCAGAVLAHVPAAVAWHDGPDWAERSDPATRLRQKENETAWLAERIPGPDGRARPWTGHPAVVLGFPTDGEDPAAVIRAIRSVMNSGIDCGVWLQGGDAAGLHQRHFASIPSVSAGDITASAAATAHVRAQMSHPLCIPAETWRDLLRRLAAGGRSCIELTLQDGRLTLCTNRSHSRARRWAAQFPGGEWDGLLLDS